MKYRGRDSCGSAEYCVVLAEWTASEADAWEQTEIVLSIVRHTARLLFRADRRSRS